MDSDDEDLQFLTVSEGRLLRQQQSLNTELLNAAGSGDLTELQRALDAGAHINTVCREHGVTASHIAAFLGHISILKHLLSKGSKQKRDFNDRLPIDLADKGGRADAVKILKCYGSVKPSAGKIKLGESKPEDKKLEKLKKLKKLELIEPRTLDSWDHNRPTPHDWLQGSDAQSNESPTDLMIYISNDDLESVENFLTNLVKPSEPGSSEPGPSEVRSIIEVIENRFENNINVLHIAAEQGSSLVLQFLLSNYQECVTRLVNEKENCKGTTPLLIAARRGYAECVKLLLRLNPDVGVTATANFYPYCKGTALHAATWMRHGNVVKILLHNKHQKLLSSVDGDKQYPLNIAIRLGNMDCIREIILGGGSLADFTGESKEWTAFERLTHVLPQAVKYIEHLLDSSITEDAPKTPNPDNRCATLTYNVLFPAADDESRNDVNQEQAQSSEGNGTNNSSSSCWCFRCCWCTKNQSTEAAENSREQVELGNNAHRAQQTTEKTTQRPCGGQMCVLLDIVTSDNNQLREVTLPHPLVETFLFYKWQKVKFLFWIFIIIDWSFKISLAANALLPSDNTIPLILRAVCYGSLIMLIIIKEAFHFFWLKKYYRYFLGSYLKLAITILAVISLILLLTGPKKALTHVSCSVVLLASIDFLYSLSSIPGWGHSITMFFSVAQTFIEALGVFFVLLLGFTLAFLIQFEGKEPFDDFWPSLMKVIVMTSELDYDSISKGITSNTTSNEVSSGSHGEPNPVALNIIFVLFIVLVAVSLMNFTVGLAVSSTTETQGNAKWISKQVYSFSFIEEYTERASKYKWLPKWFRPDISVEREMKIWSHGDPIPQKLRNSVFEIPRSCGSKN